jgi:hypothetical protein
MATSSKVSALSRANSVAGSTLLLITVDPDGTPTSQAITVAKVFANVSMNVVFSTSSTFSVQGNQILAPKTRPANPAAGQIYFDSENAHFYGYDGTVWKQLDN